MLTLAAARATERCAFVERFGGVFERSPWVAERAHARGPFANLEALHAAMMACVREASREEQVALACAHPELAGREASEGTLGASSAGEQERLGFTALSRTELAQMAELNRRYRDKFGFPCIVALRLHASRAAVLAEMERRLENEPDMELSSALEQIGHIARGRLEKLLAGS